MAEQGGQQLSAGAVSAGVWPKAGTGGWKAPQAEDSQAHSLRRLKGQLSTERLE